MLPTSAAFWSPLVREVTKSKVVDYPPKSLPCGSEEVRVWEVLAVHFSKLTGQSPRRLRLQTLEIHCQSAQAFDEPLDSLLLGLLPVVATESFELGGKRLYVRENGIGDGDRNVRQPMCRQASSVALKSNASSTNSRNSSSR